MIARLKQSMRASSHHHEVNTKRLKEKAGALEKELGSAKDEVAKLKAKCLHLKNSLQRYQAENTNTKRNFSLSSQSIWMEGQESQAVPKSTSMLSLLRSSVPVSIQALQGQFSQRNKSVTNLFQEQKKKKAPLNSDIMEVSDNASQASTSTKRARSKANLKKSLNSAGSLESILRYQGGSKGKAPGVGKSREPKRVSRNLNLGASQPLTMQHLSTTRNNPLLQSTSSFGSIHPSHALPPQTAFDPIPSVRSSPEISFIERRSRSP